MFKIIEKFEFSFSTHYRYGARPLSEPSAFCFCWAGVKATHGVYRGKVSWLLSTCAVAYMKYMFCII